MRVLAVEAFLVAVDHGFPVEVARVVYAAAIRACGEVHCGEDGFEAREEFFEGWCEGGDCGEDEAG